MKLSYMSPASPLEDARPLASHDVRSRTIEVDLDRTFEVADKRPLRPWPLDLMLGIDGSTTRLIELAVWAPGYDWARGTLGLSRARTGTKVSGREAVAVIDQAVQARSGDLRKLERIAARLASEDSDLTDRAVLAAASDLKRLVHDVRVTPSDYSGPEGQLVMAYESDDLIALAGVELMRRTEEHGPILRPCGNCGRLFAPLERADEEYCRRAAPGEPFGGRQCRQVGPQRRYASTVDELTSAYRREYKRLDKRQRRGGFSREALDTWRDAARDLLAVAKRDRWSADRYQRELAKREPEGRS